MTLACAYDREGPLAVVNFRACPSMHAAQSGAALRFGVDHGLPTP